MTSRAPSRQRREETRLAPIQIAKATILKWLAVYQIATVDDQMPHLNDKVTSEDFRIRINLVRDKISKTFKGNARGEGLRFLRKICIQFAAQSGRTLYIPTAPRKLKREMPLITENWAMRAYELQHWFSRFEERVAKITAAAECDCESLLGVTLFSAMMGSLLTDSGWLRNLEQQLRCGTFTINRSPGGYPAIDLSYEIKSGTANRSIDGKDQRYVRWPLDPVTLGLAIQLVSQTRLQPMSKIVFGSSRTARRDTDEPEMFRLIRDSIFGKGVQARPNGKPSVIETYRHMAEAAFYVAATRPGNRLPFALVEGLMGRHQNSPLDDVAQDGLVGLRATGRQDKYDLEIFGYNDWTRWASQMSASKVASSSLDNLEAIKRIKDVFKKDTALNERQQRHKIVNLLQKKLMSGISHPGENVILSWTYELMEVRGLQLSTVRPYQSRTAKRFLQAAHNIDLSNPDGTELWEAYRKALDTVETDAERAPIASALRSLHQFAQSSPDFQWPELPEPIADGLEILHFVRARTFNWQAILAIRGAISDPSSVIGVGLTPWLRRTLCLIVTLAFRTGLRLGELCKLRLGDIENSPEMFVFVRGNQFGTNKTPSALRKVPLAAILTPNEMGEFRGYLKDRRDAARSDQSSPLFIPSLEAGHLNRSAVSTLVSRAMTMAFGGFGWTFHHLRHSAFNGYAALLMEADNLTTLLTGWTPEHASQVRAAIHSSAADRRDIFWSLAVLAGHSNPRQTFESYLHILPDIAAELSGKAAPIFRAEVTANATGLDLNAVKSCETLDALKSLMTSQRPGDDPIWADWGKSDPNPSHELIGHRSSEELAKLAGLSGPSITDCRVFLENLSRKELSRPVKPKESGQAPSEQKWRASAFSLLKDLRSQKDTGRARLKDELNNLEAVWPRTGEDRRLLASVLASAKDMIAAGEDVKLRIWVALALRGATGSRPGIRFNSPADLRVFLACKPDCLPLHDWDFDVSLLDGPAFQARMESWGKAVFQSCETQGASSNRDVHPKQPSMTLKVSVPKRAFKAIKPGTAYARFLLLSTRGNGSGKTSREAAITLRAAPYVLAVFLGMKAKDIELGRKQPGFTKVLAELPKFEDPDLYQITMGAA